MESQETFFVSPNGSGVKDGSSIDNAFGRIQDCVDKLRHPGDRCLLLDGHYHEEVIVDGKFGTEDRPILIEGYEGSWPVLDGTTEIHGNWKRLEEGNDKNLPIYYAEYEEKVWQLFFDGEMMTNARWPKSTEQRLYDLGGIDGTLAKSGVDATDAVAVMNIGSWDTVVSKVLQHKAGQDWFDFQNTWGKLIHFQPQKGKYFFEAKLEFLDNEEEWFIDDKYIYLWPPHGKDPNSAKVVGKKSSFAFTISNSSNLVFKNMDFFATAIKTSPIMPWMSCIGNLGFENLNFKYPSYSRRILGEAKAAEAMNMDGKFWKPAWMGKLNFLNCSWFGSDGVALKYSMGDVRLNNNIWELNDWSVANTDVKPTGGYATVQGHNSLSETFTRNSLRNNGAAHGYIPWKKTVASLNEITGQCWGMSQEDGGGFQLMTGAQRPDSNVSFNWVHDSPKNGIRFDTANSGNGWINVNKAKRNVRALLGPGKIGTDATIYKNVVWNSGGIKVKGERHHVISNLAFTPGRCQLPNKFNWLKGSIVVYHWVGSNPVPFNNETEVVNNIANYANGGKSRITNKLGPLSGSPVANNFPDPWNSCDEVQEFLEDAGNKDFRPKQNSRYAKAGAGPYQPGMSTEYWIPGRQNLEASHPIPPNSATVNPNRDALMFLQGFEAHGHSVYFSKNKEMVKNRAKEANIANLQDSANMVTIPHTLEEGKQYYWAVDALKGNEVYFGTIWNFFIAARH